MRVRNKDRSLVGIKDHRGVNLISDALPFGRLWYAEPRRGASNPFV
jgi:hypothetical protein